MALKRWCSWPGVTLLVAWLLLLAAGCSEQTSSSGAAGSEANLLAGREPVRSVGVRAPKRLTDGVRAVEGDHWNTNLTAFLQNPAAYVEYDLGSSKQIRAAYLQGDNNDRYMVGVSDDRRNYKTLWSAPAVGGGGLQSRQSANLSGEGRYIRISATGGDGSYTLSEVQLYTEKPSPFPPEITARRGIRSGETTRSAILQLALALALALFVTRRNNSWWWLGLVGAGVAVAAFDTFLTLRSAWPVEAREVSMVRACAAAIAGLALLREFFGPTRWPAHRAVVIGALAISAAAAMAAFFNLGRPQFFDRAADEPSYIHPFDMRVYFPQAKYFEELRFDGVYVASVAAYADDDAGRNLSSMQNVELRDLHTHRMVKVGEVHEDIEEVKRRFTPERWEAFKRDMRYFRETMGAHGYLSSMKDHGGNATPVWLTIAHVVFSQAQAGDFILGIGALLDPLLLLLTFGMIGWTFGPRTMLVSMVVFGANDFYMFGSNWVGATLRHDWMAYLGLAACALKREKWILGGALLGLASLIRAFPALAVAALVLPMAWWVWEYRLKNAGLPKLAELRQAHRPLERTLLGGAACVISLIAVSSAVFGVDAWLEWLDKVLLLSRDPHVNHISLRALVAGSEHTQGIALQERLPLYIASLAVCIGAVVVACRHKRLEQAAMFGLILIPVIFYPANYYIHFIFLLPLVAVERWSWSGSWKRNADAQPTLDRADVVVWLSLLGICVAQYWTVLTSDLELHFYLATTILFAGLAALLAAVLQRDLKRAPLLAPAAPSKRTSGATTEQPSRTSKSENAGQGAADEVSS